MRVKNSEVVKILYIITSYIQLQISPCCFEKPDDTSWHVEEEEGEDDDRHHPDSDYIHYDDADNPDYNPNHDGDGHHVD